jgi:hypothetical protein
MTQEMIAYRTEIENIKTAAEEDAGFEKILKFKKGDYLIGEDPVSLGTEYIAHAIGWTKCWIKFVNGEVAERKIYRVAHGEKPPERDELDDQDESQWKVGIDGKPADPWVFQYLLPLEDPARRHRRLRHFVLWWPARRRRSLHSLCETNEEDRQQRPADRKIGCSRHADEKIRQGGAAGV